MYTREKDGIIYIYRNQDIFLNSMSGCWPNGSQMMQMADYAIQITNLGDSQTIAMFGLQGSIVKDRSGTFSANEQKVNFLLKNIMFLYEEQEKLV